MIQAMSAARSVVNERAEAAAPMPAAATLDGTAPADAANPLDAALHAFGQRMAQLDETTDEVAPESPQILSEQALPAQLDGAPQLPADAAQAAVRAPEESAAEQWLLGMLGQQQLVVATREVAVAQAAPAVMTTTAAPGNAAPLPIPALVADRLPAMQNVAAQTAAPPPEVDQQPDSPLPAAISSSAEAARNVPAAAAMPATSVSPAQAGMPLAVETPAPAPVEPPAATAQVPDSALAAEPARAPQASASEATLRLQAPQARWGEQMLQALREHVDLQLQQKVQSATIRLDPPELGAMEILLSHESGRLTVQLSAAQADVARLLQQTSDRLRQELVSQHFVQVSVQVGAEGQGQHGQPRQGAPRANHEPSIAGQRPADPLEDQTARGSRDVLVTV